MPQISELIEPAFDGEPRHDQDMLEAISTLGRTNKTSDRMQWNVELAREWAFLGGD